MIFAESNRPLHEPCMSHQRKMQFMDIPDLEAEEDLSRQVAAAPAARSVSVIDIAELESADLFRLPVVAKDHEVDLSLLTACLCPAAEVSRIFRRCTCRMFTSRSGTHKQVLCLLFAYAPIVSVPVHICCRKEWLALQTCRFTVLGLVNCFLDRIGSQIHVLKETLICRAR